VTPKSTTPASLTWSGATARRMARSALTEPATDRGPADIAGLMCGAHAQVLSAAELSIGRRIAGATREDVQRALWEDRTLVKTFGPPRHGAPAAHRRPADVDRGAVDPAVVGADASRAGPVHRSGREAWRHPAGVPPCCPPVAPHDDQAWATATAMTGTRRDPVVLTVTGPLAHSRRIADRRDLAAEQ
jgi:hypothetical protein